MIAMKSKGSLLATLEILLAIGITSLVASSESFAEEVGQTNVDVTFYGGRELLKTEGAIKPVEQLVTDKDKETLQQQDKMSRKTTAKANPTNAQTSSLGIGEQNSTWLYSLGIACLLVVLTSFYYLSKRRKREKQCVVFINRVNVERGIQMEVTMWIWICASLAVLCFVLFLLFLVNSMNFVYLAKPKQSLVKQSMLGWLLLVICGGWVVVAILLNIVLQTQLT